MCRPLRFHCSPALSLLQSDMGTIGTRQRRVEDPRLIRGEGQYTADLHLSHLAHAAFIRSPFAHARIRQVDLSAARALPGVIAAYDSATLPAVGRPLPLPPEENGRGRSFSPLANGTARYAGEPVAVILAEDPYLAADAVEMVNVDWEELPVAAGIEPGEPAVWPELGDNVAGEAEVGFGEVDHLFARAEVVVEGRFVHPRAAGAAMEPRAVAASPNEPGHQLTVWSSTQVPHRLRDALAEYLDLDPARVRAVAPNVGGGFGVKGRIYPEEYVVAALALRHGRPMRWVATRTEDLMTTCHGRGQVHHARLAARADGTILALDDHVIQDVGAYSPSGVGIASNTARHLMGPYRLAGLRVRLSDRYTNRVPTSALRGGGRPEGIYVIERLLDRLAGRLGMERAEVRRRNLLPPEAFPYDTHFPTPHGTVVYDSGRYPAYLDSALRAIDYQGFRQEQSRARAKGRHLGLGLVTFIESTGVGTEAARVRLDAAGQVTVTLGSPSQGQGHATTFAQTVAMRLGVPIEQVTVLSGDTAVFPTGFGTFASRMGQFGNNAAGLAAAALRERLFARAADELEIAPTDLELAAGRIEVRGMPGRGITLAELAASGEALYEDHDFAPERPTTWAGGANAAIVEVDTATGQVQVLRYVVVHDSGTVVNPLVVEGQIHGGVAHGLGNALYEVCVYTPEGQLVTTTLADYSLPGAGDVPEVEIVHYETPSPFNPEGIKGAGEGGTIAAIPTLVSAIEDALAPFGASLSDVPVVAEQIVHEVATTTVRRSEP